MANQDHARWSVDFTMPADGHAFQHHAVMNGPADELWMRRHIKSHVNPDWKIKGIERLPDDIDEAQRIVAAKDAKNIQQHPDYRAPAFAEPTMHAKHVEKRKAELTAAREEYDVDEVAERAKQVAPASPLAQAGE